MESEKDHFQKKKTFQSWKKFKNLSWTKLFFGQMSRKWFFEESGKNRSETCLSSGRNESVENRIESGEGSIRERSIRVSEFFWAKCLFLLFFVHLLPKLRTYFHICLIDGAARIFSYLICCDWESNSRQLSCTSLRDLNSGRFTSWATAAVAFCCCYFVLDMLL